MNAPPPDVKAVFDRALEIDAPAERQAYLDGIGAESPEVRRRVEGLLRAYEDAGSFLEPPTRDEPPRERPGTVIGPYKLLQQIGEGGMGVVYMAEQQEPIRRKVALKIIKPGMDSAQVIARFEAERQALAMMDHQNIAKVFDAGTTDNGRPYFVMELVHGVPITKFCDDNKLTPRERLQLFMPVCQAIQHAHQKGIIHRDIKPSNVLVTMYDDKPVPKVIDFGVAKAIEQHLTDKTMFTQFGALLGTFEYMSPEQAEMNAFGVDTRSDVYSLGVLLYELLTGTTPLERSRLRDAALDELVRLIREEEPPRPSARLSTSGTLAKIAAARKTEPKQLSKLMRGELDWIVMKSLEKDRTRRYETANGLARDVERYLADEPVEACPPSAGYQLRKFARKNKKALATAATIAVLLVAGTALSTWQAMRASRAERGAVAARDEEKQARAEAEVAQRKAENFAARLAAANSLIVNALSDAHEGRWAAAHASLTKAAEILPEHLPVLLLRGDLYVLLGLWDLAATDYARFKALGGRHQGGFQGYVPALLAYYSGDDASYRAACKDLLQWAGDNPERASSMELVRACVLDPKAVTDPNDLVKRAEETVARKPINWHLYVAGLAHYRAGQYEQAVNRFQQSLTMNPDWDARAINYPGLAMALYRLGKPDEAREALASADQALDALTEAMLQEPVGRIPIRWWDWLECQLLCREAHKLLTGSPRADDPRLRMIRQRALAALK